MALTAQLQSLIDKRDNREIIRDQVAAILKVESAGQEALAMADSQDPTPWKLRVFSERAEPWGLVTEDNHLPIINVWVETSTFEKGRSNLIEEQTCKGTFHIDCCGFGVAESTDAGHTAADRTAVLEAERAARLCRNILMSSYYTYLGFPQQVFLPEGSKQVVYERWTSSMTSFQPALETRSAARVAAVRLDLEVTYSEFSPQYQGQPLEILTYEVTRASDGELLASVLLDETGYVLVTP